MKLPYTIGSLALNIALLIALIFALRSCSLRCPCATAGTDSKGITTVITHDTIWPPANQAPDVSLNTPQPYKVIGSQVPSGDLGAGSSFSPCSPQTPSAQRRVNSLTPGEPATPTSIGSGSSPSFNPGPPTPEGGFILNAPGRTRRSQQEQLASQAPSGLSPREGMGADTAFYTDTTLRANKYKLIINDTLTANRIVGRGKYFFDLEPIITTTVTKTIPLHDKLRIYGGAFTGIELQYPTRKVTNWTLGPAILITEPHGVAVGYGFDAKNNGHEIFLYYQIKLGKQ